MWRSIPFLPTLLPKASKYPHAPGLFMFHTMARMRPSTPSGSMSMDAMLPPEGAFAFRPDRLQAPRVRKKVSTKR